MNNFVLAFQEMAPAADAAAGEAVSSGVTTSYIAVMPLIIVGGLFLFALAILGHVLLASREKRFSLRGFFGLLFAAVWALPVLAVLGWLGARSLPHLQEPSWAERMTVSAEPPGPPKGTLVSVDSNKVGIPVDPDEDAVEEDASLPEWVGQPDQQEQGVTTVALSSQQWATVDEGRRQIYQMAAERIREDFHREYPNHRDWSLPAASIERRLVGEPYVQEIERTTGNKTFTVYRLHQQLALSDDLPSELYPIWRDQIVGRRLWILGGLLGVATMILATAAIYLRLDASTGGTYRFRLKLAAVALIVACGLGMAMWIPAA